MTSVESFFANAFTPNTIISDTVAVLSTPSNTTRLKNANTYIKYITLLGSETEDSLSTHILLWRTAVHQRALLVHPDKHIGGPKNNSPFQRLNNAYDKLKG